MIVNRQKIAAVLIAGVAWGVTPAVAASPLGTLSGVVAGYVSDASGVPQMGATALLFNRYEKLIAKVLTNEKGSFGFADVSPDLYSVRVSLASFVPAVKRNISVQPGMRSFLTINLASVFSSVELVYSVPGQGTLMSEDWKWVLRGSMSTRPVLRYLPRIDVSDPASRQRQPMFSDTRGIVRVSAGDMGMVSSASSEPDLGTAFALATSLYGSSHIQFSGNFGYSAQGGAPAAGFRTSFAPTIAGAPGPQVNLTMRQLFVPGRVGAAFVSGQRDGTPGLRTVSASVAESKRITESMELDVGMSLESITFLDHLNYFSPYARLSYALGRAGAIQLGFSSGMPPVEMFAANASPESEFQKDLAALSAFPRVSRRDARVRVQRSQDFEIGYTKSFESRTTASLGVYRETLSNYSLTMLAPAGLYSVDDLLPDPFSGTSIFNIGSFSRTGITASVTQNFGDSLTATVAFGNNGVLTAAGRTLETDDPNELRGLIRPGRRNWASARISATAPLLGTRLVSSYEWTDYAALTTGHRYLTQRFTHEPGLNLLVRQPIGGVPGVSGRLEATAEIRNALAQGYLPMTDSAGRHLVLVQSPRSLRGGLSFIF